MVIEWLTPRIALAADADIIGRTRGIFDASGCKTAI
jgi:hypothetical protein